MKKIFLFLFSIALISVKAQTKSLSSYKDYMLEGQYLLLEESYELAIQNFEEAYKLDSTNANVNYKLGISYLNTPLNKNKAERFLSVAVKNVSKSCNLENPLEKTSPPLAHFYYGQALHINYKFDEALQQYNIFEKYVNSGDKEWKKLLAKEKASSAFAKEIMTAPLNLQITNLGDSINTNYPEYSPVLSADERTIIYTTRRPTTTGGIKDENGYYNEDVVVSYKDDKGNWSAPVSLSPNINGSGMEASVNLTPDGQTLILYRDGGEGMGGNIYYSTFDGKDWSPLKEFGSDVNTKYWESHACLSSDGNTLFFVSNRPGGMGGRDIYRCVKLPNGKWSKALNMGAPINTEYDEDGAFIHPDGKTFFFTSNGHKTMGGFDIMFATLSEDNKFTDVQNIGYPINTTDDDAFYVTSPDGRRGYFSSAKDGGFGEKDIYMVSMPESKEKALALFKGQIIPADGEKLPEDLVIIVRDKATGEIVGTYKPKLVNGTFSTILPPGREYNFSYQAPAGQEFYNEDVFVTNDISYQEIKREVNLEPVTLLGKIKAKSNAIVLTSVVFDNTKSKKAVQNANVTITDETGAVQSFTTDDKGRIAGVNLAKDKEYTIVAESNGKKSTPIKINTKTVKPPKIFNQILYLDGKPAASGEIVLNVFVKNSANKALSNAAVVLTDADGNKFEGTTDETGHLKGVPLDADTKYELYAGSEGNYSEKAVFNTNGLKGKKTIQKNLIVAESAGVVSSNVSEGEYEFYFTYNKRNIDQNEASWTNFINKVAELSKQKQVTVEVNSSASRVPTRAYKNNKQLAVARGRKTIKHIRLAVEAKGGNVANIKMKRRSKVDGPRYMGDFNMRKKYEPFQFVKAKVY